MKRIIVNGANGYVASHFILELLELNYEVIALVRQNHDYSAKERMLNNLEYITDGRYVQSDNLKIYPYSLFEENLSIPEEQLQEIFAKETDYFHFAASLKYDAKSRYEIFKTNISGVKNSINLFSERAKLGSRFFLISTAYSCGKINEPFKEIFYDNIEDIAAFRNYYEQSKRFAENVFREKIEEEHFPGHIIRLSQVIGDSSSGITKTDYGIFDFARRVYNLAHRYPGELIRVKVDAQSTQNLIPIDTVVQYLLKITESNAVPLIINMVGKSITNGFIIESLCKLLPIQLIPDSSLDTNSMTVYERIMSIGMSFTGGYSKTNIIFETQNLESLFKNSSEDILNESDVFRMLQYFVKSLSKDKVYSSVG